MRLTFLGKESQPNNSPTLYSTDNDSYLVQGWIVSDPAVLAAVTIGDDETIVEVPPGLMQYLAKAGVVGDVSNLVPPIVHVNEQGNYIIQGPRVHDVEALAQMDIPDHETCVEVTRAAMLALIGG
jgi:hypothetical protein